MKKLNLLIPIFIIGLTGLTMVSAPAVANEPLVIDGRTIEPGTKKSWTMIASETALGPVGVPVTVINGKEAGPVFAITGATHPSEITGVLASAFLAKRIDPDELSGALLIVHVQNVKGFESRTKYLNPLDLVNFSKAYPLEKLPDTVHEERHAVYHRGTSMSHYIAEKIDAEIIRHADYHVDAHGGELHEMMTPNIEIFPQGQEELDEKIRFLAKAFGFPVIWETAAGSIDNLPSYGTKATESPRSGSSGAAFMRGIPSVTLEIGSQGTLDMKEVDLALSGLKSVMAHLGMIEGEKAPLDHSRVLIGGVVLYAKRGGLFVSNVTVGVDFPKGKVLGTTYNLAGDVVESFVSPANGFLTNLNTLSTINPGDMMYVIAYTD
jgi:predicted deacylase